MAAAQLSSMSLAARPVALRAPRASARFGLKPVNARSVTAMYTVTLVTPDGEQVRGGESAAAGSAASAETMPVRAAAGGFGGRGVLVGAPNGGERDVGGCVRRAARGEWGDGVRVVGRA